MKNNPSSYFEDPEFQEILAKYEGMVEHHTPVYFDADELVDIAEYYASNGRHEESEEAIDFALKLHPGDTEAMVFRAHSLAFRGDLKEAYRVMRLINDQSDREVQFLQADLLMDENRAEEADEVLDRLARTEEEELDTLMDIVQAYIDYNRKDMAYKWLMRIKFNHDTDRLLEEDQEYEAWCATITSTSTKRKRPYPYCKSRSTQTPTPSTAGTTWPNATWQRTTT